MVDDDYIAQAEVAIGTTVFDERSRDCRPSSSSQMISVIYSLTDYLFTVSIFPVIYIYTCCVSSRGFGTATSTQEQ